MKHHLLAGAVAAGVALATGVLTAGPAQAADPVSGIGAGLTTVNLLNINDFHGRIATADGGLKLACTVVTQRAALGADQSVFLSAGDNVGATPFISSSQEDNPTLAYLNTLGLRASAVGNHEFDRGWGDLSGRILPRASFDYLGANVYQRGTTTPVLKEYVVVPVSGLRVAIIGAVTQQTPSMVAPTGVSGLDFGDPVAAVNRVATQLKASDAADVIVAEYHEGAPSNGPLATETAASTAFNHIVADTSPLVGAIFTGHTHQSYLYDGPTTPGTRPIIQSASYGTLLGRVQLGIDPVTKQVKQYTATNLKPADVTPACESNPQFAAVKGIVQTAEAQAKILGGTVIGSITADITTAFADAKPVNGVYAGATRDDRQRESALGNLSAEAWKDAMNVPGRPGADIGVMNPGGLRSELRFNNSAAGEKPGEITYAEAAAIHPFANTMQTRELTGAQFKKALEQQWQPAGAARPFLKLGLSSNVTYTYDATRAAGDRITSITYNGAPMDLAATYRVTAGSFLMAGGDNFTAFAEGTNLKDSGLIDTDVFINYIKSHSPVSPSFAKNGVEVLGMPSTVRMGVDTLNLTVQGVDLTSLGAPANTTLQVMANGKVVGTYPIETVRLAGVPTKDGRAAVTLHVTAKSIKPSTSSLTLVAQPSGTRITIPVVFAR
ncbi:MAG TPA: bifunctional UDP-sugar hydrolase/5'-nucleotidase [Phycicoccus sp.]|nr:bifunctional UDP-sugar hydrolase/5'-nucleotidase [Phycicoccus sp.]